MKFRFKIQSYQTEAVKAVVDCFDGQPLQTGLGYRIDPGRVATGQQARLEMDSGFKNSDLLLPAEAILKNIQAVQVRQNLPVSESLKQTKVSSVNLDVEMETGTGKTYCYIKTIFELNKKIRLVQVHCSRSVDRNPGRRGLSRLPTRRNISWRVTARGSARSFTTPRRCTIWRASAPTPAST